MESGHFFNGVYFTGPCFVLKYCGRKEHRMTVHASGEYWERVLKTSDPETADFSQSRPHENLPSYCDIYLKRKARILDLGCGGGRNAQYLAREGCEVHGVDISQSAIGFCQRRLKRFNLSGTFKQGEMTEIPCEDGFFDGIVCVAALDHVTMKGAGKAIKEMRRVKTSEATMFITFDPPGRDKEIRGEAEEQEDGSLYFVKGEQKGMLFRRYTDDEIRNLIGIEKIVSFEHSRKGDRIIVCR